VVTLEEFLDGRTSATDPQLILRHDVDQDVRSALRMSNVEVELGLRSTWYFRWRTADPAVIEELRRRGVEIGLHYETLSRTALRAGGDWRPASADIEAARELLRKEIEGFQRLFGEVRSVAAHGDTRAPYIRNAELMRDQEWSDYGVDYDANDAMRRHRLATWLTDRAGPEGSWAEGAEPQAMLREGMSPILCLTHPNNWSSGISLWLDRLATALRRSPDEPRLA
jgi:hypothetical protein